VQAVGMDRAGWRKHRRRFRRHAARDAGARTYGNIQIVLSVRGKVMADAPVSKMLSTTSNAGSRANLVAKLVLLERRTVMVAGAYRSSSCSR
jgi:hypothetical protein